MSSRFHPSLAEVPLQVSKRLGYVFRVQSGFGPLVSARSETKAVVPDLMDMQQYITMEPSHVKVSRAYLWLKIYSH